VRTSDLTPFACRPSATPGLKGVADGHLRLGRCPVTDAVGCLAFLAQRKISQGSAESSLALARSSMTQHSIGKE